MEIGGFTPMTTIDFPGRLAAVVFCQGCPWRCGYCQNEHLIPRRAEQPVAWSKVLALLQRRRGLLDAVVFSGGEPTLQRGLVAALREVRGLGFQTGLHTGGPYPGRLSEALPELDWVGFDIKAPLEDYPALTEGGPGSGERAWDSLRRVLDSGVDYEVRTTVHPKLLGADALRRLAAELARLGVRNYALQACVSERCLNPALRAPQASGALDQGLTRELATLFASFTTRAA